MTQEIGGQQRECVIIRVLDILMVELEASEEVGHEVHVLRPPTTPDPLADFVTSVVVQGGGENTGLDVPPNEDSRARFFVVNQLFVFYGPQCKCARPPKYQRGLDDVNITSETISK